MNRNPFEIAFDNVLAGAAGIRATAESADGAGQENRGTRKRKGR